MAASVQDLNADHHSCAAWIARFLKARGVDRIFGLQGGHIQPIWDHAAQLGIRIVDVRHEAAAVHMAHAHAELTGELGVAMVTAGPGVTNTVTAVANASLARAPVLVIGGCTSRAQANLGPLQDIPHVEILRPVTRQSRTLRVADQVIREFDEGVSRAFGDLGEPGPVYLEIPTDVLRTHVPANLVLEEWMAAERSRASFAPDAAIVAEAVEALWSAKRPLVVTGRGARDAGPEIVRLLDALGAVYLDTQESRGLVPADHPAAVGAMRAAAMTEADTVFVIGRKLDYQLGYGSPAVFPNAKFIRLADTPGRTHRQSPRRAGNLRNADARARRHRGRGRQPQVGRRQSLGGGAAETASRPQRQGLGQATRQDRTARSIRARFFRPCVTRSSPDYIAIADGGDLLSFARVGLDARTYMDAGAFGCLGVGTPYAVAAALAYPGRQVVCVTGDGAFGINAMEIDTAVRHGAKIVVIVSNNAAWNIERLDQEANYGGRVVGTLLAHSDYAAMARAFGAHGERVEKPEDLPGAIERALANAPALVDVVTSQTVVSSDATKGLGFVPEFQPLTVWDDLERKRRGLL